MSDSTNTTIKTGVGFGGGLTICFVVLKLLGKINWPWYWVVGPLWVPWAITIAILIIIIGCIYLFELVRALKRLLCSG